MGTTRRLWRTSGSYREYQISQSHEFNFAISGKRSHFWLITLLIEKSLCVKQWQSVAFPLSLTCLMYAGSLVLKTLLLIDSFRRYTDSLGGFSFDCVNYALRSTLDRGISVAYSVLAWRNYVVVSNNMLRNSNLSIVI